METLVTKYGSISLSVAQCAFLPGATLRGEVLVDVTTSVEAFTCLTVTFSGAVTTRVTGNANREDHGSRFFEQLCEIQTTYVPMEVKETFDPETSCFSLPEGQYRFPFELEVPSNAPPTAWHSSMGSSGRVEYYLNATLTPPASKGGVLNKLKEIANTKIIKREITVLAIRNPQSETASAEPISGHNHKSFTWSRSKGEVFGTVTLERQLFHPGDQVNITIDVVNESSKTVKSTTVELLAVGHLSAGRTDHMRYQSRVVMTSVPEKIKPGEKRTFGAMFEVPSNFDQFRVEMQHFTRAHVVRAIFDMSGFTMNLVVPVDIELLPKVAPVPPAAIVGLM